MDIKPVRLSVIGNSPVRGEVNKYLLVVRKRFFDGISVSLELIGMILCIDLVLNNHDKFRVNNNNIDVLPLSTDLNVPEIKAINVELRITHRLFI